MFFFVLHLEGRFLGRVKVLDEFAGFLLAFLKSAVQLQKFPVVFAVGNLDNFLNSSKFPHHLDMVSPDLRFNSGWNSFLQLLDNILPLTLLQHLQVNLTLLDVPPSELPAQRRLAGVETCQRTRDHRFMKRNEILLRRVEASQTFVGVGAAHIDGNDY